MKTKGADMGKKGAFFTWFVVYTILFIVLLVYVYRMNKVGL